MTNVVLLAVAVVAVCVALWRSIARTSAAWPPTVLAVIMLAVALGGPVWEWSKWAEGAGLPPDVPAPAFGQSLAVPAFLWASLGASLSTLLVPRGLPAATTSEATPKTWTLPRPLSIGVVVLSFLTHIAWLIGQGPSFFRREIYTQTDGNDFLLRASFPLGIMLALIAVAAAAVEQDKLLRALLITTAAIEFVALTAIGSRTALAFPLLAAVLLIANEIRKRRIHPGMMLAGAGLLILPVLTFGVIKQARMMPHGLLNLPSVVSTYVADTLTSTDSFLLPVKQLTASIFAAFPIGEKSVTYGVDLGVLLANANPLPGTAEAMELERYWPYEWVPLCFAGTWYGAVGWVGQLVLFAAIGWVTGYTAYNFQRGRLRFLSFVPMGVAALIAVLAIQYPSRMVWRLISVAVILMVLSYLTRDRHPILAPVVTTPFLDAAAVDVGNLHRQPSRAGT